MADGLAWDDLAPELEGPGVGIRRTDAGGLAKPHPPGCADGALQARHVRLTKRNLGLIVPSAPQARSGVGLEAEWRVAVGDQEEGVGAYPVVPAEDAFNEVE